VNNGRYNGCGGGKSKSLRVLKSFLGNIQQSRLFSVSRNLLASSGGVPPKPVKVYKNAGVDMERILQENKGKAGVYCWINLLNQKCYIGSSTNLSRRLKTYFRISFLETQIKSNASIIYRALLKNGYSNFSLEILEYCSPENAISREQYYIDLLKPDYNILRTAGSFLGFKHSEETLAKFRIQSPKQQEHLKRLNSSPESVERLLEISKARRKRVELLDTLNNITTVYSSIAEAAQVIACDPGTIRYAIKNLQEKGISTLIKARYKLVTKGLEQVEAVESNYLLKVEVLDTLTSESTVYPSISEAARALGYSTVSVWKALQNSDKGVKKLLKKRYAVKRCNEKS
jgi:group I intron endonuclease